MEHHLMKNSPDFRQALYDDWLLGKVFYPP